MKDMDPILATAELIERVEADVAILAEQWRNLNGAVGSAAKMHLESVEYIALNLRYAAETLERHVRYIDKEDIPKNQTVWHQCPRCSRPVQWLRETARYVCSKPACGWTADVMLPQEDEA